MRDAIEMQLRRFAPWASRAVAVLTATCILLSGVLALRHEASVAHVRDGLNGKLQHAHALAEAHAEDTTPHLHGRNVDAHGESGGCALLAALEHATMLPSTTPEITTLPVLQRSTIDSTDVHRPARALYWLAPKTSPPTRA